MKKIRVYLALVILLSILLIKGSFGIISEEVKEDSLTKIDSELLSAEGETSVIIEFSKKPKNYKSIINSLGGKIVRDYNIIEGIEVKIDGKNITKLTTLENLIKINKNKKVKNLLHESAPLISTDLVWNLNFTGKDVKVCVIDTGVDYKHPALGSCNPLFLNGTTETHVLESPHPYPPGTLTNPLSLTWNITKPGYSSIAVHFVNISIEVVGSGETQIDFLHIKDANGNIVQSFIGEHRDIWSVSVPGDTIQINLISDWMAPIYYGFYIDKVINGSANFSFENCSKIIDGYDFVNNDNNPFDDNKHGTHVAGIISSNDEYSRGIANGTKILVAKVLDFDGTGFVSDVITGIEWCVNNSAQIISMSLGGSEYNDTCDDDPLAIAVNNAVNKGVAVVVSAGNSGQYGLTTPSCASGAIAVGAIDKEKNVVGFSSKGPELDLLAPGYKINSTIPKNKWLNMSGTSMAAPFVTGVVALMLEANPFLSVFDIKTILSETSDNVNKCYECEWSNNVCTNEYGTEIECNKNVTGAGIVNAFKALSSILSLTPMYYNVKNPSNSIYFPNESYKISINWLGNIDKVILEFNGINYTDVEKLGNTYSKTFNDLPAGTFYYKWYANDTNDNWNSTDLLSFKIDKANPEIILLLNNFNSNLTTVEGSVVNITSQVVVGEGIIELYENDLLIQSERNIQILKNYTRGLYNITAFYLETQNYTSFSKTYFINAEEPLVITILNPQNITYTKNTIPLNFTLNKQANWVGYSLNDKNNVTITGNTTLTLNNDVYNIRLYANDTFGNIISSDKVYFTVNVPVCNCTSWTIVSQDDYQDCRYGDCYVCSIIVWKRTCNPSKCDTEYKRGKYCSML
ncbi:MAG: S8 family serine peptidase [Candidatus Aenigmatarchaeota archaeon]